MEHSMSRTTRTSLTAALVACFVLCAVPSFADDFFAGKTITLSTHSEPGGGYESYLRLLAAHMGRHIGGRTNFAIVNQPGGGGRRAVNYAAREAPQDGTFLTIVSQSVPVVEATGGKGLQTSLGAFKWIGNFTRANNVTVTWAASNVKTLQDAMAREVVMGATGAGTSSEMGPILYNSLLGTRFKIVVGYSGAEAINEAMKRGEVDGRANSTWASIKLTLRDEFKDGKVNVLIQMGQRKEKDLPDVPAWPRAADLGSGDPKKEAIAKVMSLSVTAARPLSAPPGVPDGADSGRAADRKRHEFGDGFFLRIPADEIGEQRHVRKVLL